MYYKVAHLRLSEWLVGIMFGAFLMDYKENESKHQIKRKVNKLFFEKKKLSISNYFLGVAFNSMVAGFCCVCSPICAGK